MKRKIMRAIAYTSDFMSALVLEKSRHREFFENSVCKHGMCVNAMFEKIIDRESCESYARIEAMLHYKGYLVSDAKFDILNDVLKTLQELLEMLDVEEGE